MTERCYYYSDDLAMSSEVLSCVADENGQYRAILRATLFHPQGGGQPSDGGTIAGVEVLKVQQEGEEIIHLLAAAVLPGRVELNVNPARRQRHTRMHSAGHLIGVAAEAFGWQAVKGDHRPDGGRIVFTPAEQATAVDSALLEEKVNQLVAADLPRILSDVDGLRKVTWGDLPAYACGGTHVVSTALTGRVKILSAKEKKGQLSVQYQLVD